ncbi:MAG: hypothetical protein AVDCRST_MAG89-431 [uncultured Gemmatimonadetes bacterium]|uniref:Uncharacterized protein n=1 Tax=uncultured Gemmatimonadota bacterium TaxID=203437 RepID=A0A6J4KAG6_9BACT|nr:MAG: hypothetical protein AVDCRST_MAG89-431 [uncultured Gemmatimonadota bacterium]
MLHDGGSGAGAWGWGEECGSERNLCVQMSHAVAALSTLCFRLVCASFKVNAGE